MRVLTPPPPPPLCRFSKTIFSWEEVKPWVFVICNIIIRCIFPGNFIKIPQVVQKIRRFSSWILTVFINFLNFFRISLLQINYLRQHITYVSIFFYLQPTWNRLFSKIPALLGLREALENLTSVCILCDRKSTWCLQCLRNSKVVSIQLNLRGI